MNDHVTWTVEVDKLRQVTWIFWVHDMCLVLDGYVVETRTSGRHKWTVVEAYHRLSIGRSEGRVLAESVVPLTEDIRERAVREHVSRLRVVRWSDIRPQEKGR